MSVKKLYQSINERWRPEDVLHLILQVQADSLTPKEKKTLIQAAGPVKSYSSMSNKFAQADDLARQLKIAEKIFSIPAPKTSNNPVGVKKYIQTLMKNIQVKGTDFKTDRLTRDQRESNSVEKSHRVYNKKFRHIRRMVDKYNRWIKVANIKDLAQISKSRLATRITYKDFSSDRDTACFISYMTARLNLRSLFTFGKQDDSYDKVADLLFNRLSKKKANWMAVALVHPRPEVLEQLKQSEKGRLLGEWYSIMTRSAFILKTQAEQDKPDLVNLVVKRGNDSSTWNEAAGAYNKARDGWMNTLYSLGAESFLDKFAPSKALRLMAADVVWGHKSFGSGDLEPDTAVWGELPKPWEILLDGASCTRDQIEKACKKHKVKEKGWIKPRPESKSLKAFKPTPELVHGVVVSSPELASELKKHGYFSGPTKAKKTSLVWVPFVKELNGVTINVKEA